MNNKLPPKFRLKQWAKENPGDIATAISAVLTDLRDLEMDHDRDIEYVKTRLVEILAEPQPEQVKQQISDLLNWLAPNGEGIRYTAEQINELRAIAQRLIENQPTSKEELATLGAEIILLTSPLTRLNES
uniref:Uncharacterized protein n=1 Tax=Oscillatoriales cyanobacterium SpSt-402 TaxID=2282168 RepID=A0A832H103_9CYAN